jgi:hypothetical protein
VRVVFLYGPPAAGKLTIARLVCERTGLALFHNHLVVDLATSLFEFGSPPFVELRERIWLDAMRLASETGRSLCFTFNPEATVRGDFPARARGVVERAGGRVLFVELVCPERELERRIEAPARAAFGKLRSLDRYRELRAAGAFEFPELPEPVLRLDTALLEPEAAAERIASLLEIRA